MQGDLRCYQSKYQYTGEDIAAREHKLTQLEYEVEETQSQCQLLRAQNSDLRGAVCGGKAEYEQLLEVKRGGEREVARLEGLVGEVQAGAAASGQQLRAEVGQLEAHASNLGRQLQQASGQIESLTEQIDGCREANRRLENQVANVNREMLSKSDEVSWIQWRNFYKSYS